MALSFTVASQIYHHYQSGETDVESICASAERKFGVKIDRTEATELVETVAGLVAAGERWYKVLQELVSGAASPAPSLKVVSKPKPKPKAKTKVKTK